MLTGPPLATVPADPAVVGGILQDNSGVQYLQNNTGLLASLGAAFTTTGASANTVLAATIPAGVLKAGMTVELEMWGVNSTTNTVTATWNFGATTANAVVTLATGAGWYFKVIISIASSAVQNGLSYAILGTSTVALTAPTSTAGTVNVTTGAVAVNLQLTAATGTSTANGATIKIFN